ncbi:MAG TPA: Hsp20 family protein [Bryobacteraceae bacterium]|nr:Hsp20 family protein [Bryobacteraceae bacterium]
MASLIVEKLYDGERADAPILRELNDLMNATQRRAFDLFSRRGAALGADLDDWLQAEREFLWSPQSEMVEDEKEIRIQVAAPGLDVKQVHVTALPESIIVKGDPIHKHDGGSHAVQFCEFSDKALFRKFQLDNPIDVDRVSSTLDRGILRIVAPKARSAGRQIPISHM